MTDEELEARALLQRARNITSNDNDDVYSSTVAAHYEAMECIGHALVITQLGILKNQVESTEHARSTIAEMKRLQEEFIEQVRKGL